MHRNGLILMTKITEFFSVISINGKEFLNIDSNYKLQKEQ